MVSSHASYFFLVFYEVQLQQSRNCGIPSPNNRKVFQARVFLKRNS